jgi:hypothetical protein
VFGEDGASSASSPSTPARSFSLATDLYKNTSVPIFSYLCLGTRLQKCVKTIGPATPVRRSITTLDLPQVDHGGGRARGRERATRATKSRVVDLCRLQEFKSH